MSEITSRDNDGGIVCAMALMVALLISGMMERVGGSLHDLVYCRGEYDVVATVEAPDLDSMTALKLAMMKTGAIAQMSVLESIDLNAVARQGANLIGAYKAPGN